MANLRGGSYEKQINNAIARMNALGSSKSTDSKDAHSVKTLNDRKAMLNSFADYVSSNGHSGKLNEVMTTDNINNFFDERLDGLKESTQETYIRGFGAMIESLKDNNISISSSATDYNDRVHELHRNVGDYETGRALGDREDFLNQIYEKSFESGVVAELQLELGYRVAEAHEIVSNFDRYINNYNGTLEGVIGKGGREYIPKNISQDLQAKIRDMDGESKRSYQQNLQDLGVKSHDLRYTFAKEAHENGLSASEISEELNHSRLEITEYYLARA